MNPLISPRLLSGHDVRSVRRSLPTLSSTDDIFGTHNVRFLIDRPNHGEEIREGEGELTGSAGQIQQLSLPRRPHPADQVRGEHLGVGEPESVIRLCRAPVEVGGEVRLGLHGQ
jgi:hypothetical protein